MIFSGITSKIAIGVAIAAFTFAAVQTGRIEGFLFIKGYKQDLAARDKVINGMIAAGQKAAEKQLAQYAERRQIEAKNARESDYEYKIASNDAGAAATIYIDRWRVRKDNSCSSGAVAAPEKQDAKIPEAMPAGTVMVSEGDVLACTGSAAYAIEAHNHAMRQIADGVAE